MNTHSLPWVEKYRPKQVSQVLGHDDIIRTFAAFLQKGQLPHVLLHGPPGTGKTSVVQAIVKTLCSNTADDYRVLELNASDDRGIQTVRERIKVFADMAFVNRQPSTIQLPLNRQPPPPPPSQPNLKNFFKKPKSQTPSEVPPAKADNAATVSNQSSGLDGIVVSPKLANIKLIILDEVDQMTSVAQTALRRVMEKHAHHVRFFLMCNDVNKITLPIQSRCCKFHFSPVGKQAMRQKLESIIRAEEVKITDSAIDELIKLSNGDFRKLLNTLQASYMATQQRCSSDTRVDEDSIMADSTSTMAGSEMVPEGTITVNIVRRSLGLPDQQEITNLMQALTIKPFNDSFDLLQRLMYDKGYSLVDLVDSCYSSLIGLSRDEFKDKAALTILPRLAEIKTAVAAGSSPVVQSGCLVASFIELRKEPIR